jgi:hypothetical protein
MLAIEERDFPDVAGAAQLEYPMSALQLANGHGPSAPSRYPLPVPAYRNRIPF